jgi:hypothetical protein
VVTERKVVGVRLAQRGVDAVDQVAEAAGIDRSESMRLLLAWIFSDPVRVMSANEYVRKEVQLMRQAAPVAAKAKKGKT